MRSLETDIRSSFELEHLSRVVGRRDLQAELLDDRGAPSPTCSALDSASWPRPSHRLSSSPTRTLPPIAADIAAIGIWLRPAPSTRPVVVVAEQAIGGALHVQHVLGMRADAAADAEHRLDEQRRLDQAALEEVRRRVQVADVVALDLEARAVVRARRQDVLRCP